MVLVIDCQVFPGILYMKSLIHYKHIKIEKYDNFKKMSFRNRYIIPGANGIQNLTVPVAGGREQKVLMKDIRIDNSANWQRNHWRSLVSAYNKAPFFEFYAEDVKSLLFSKEEWLFSFNINIIEWLCKTLKISATIEITGSYIDKYKDDADYRNYILPKNFQENTKNAVPHYAQVFEDRLGFQPNLSILDLLFCQGPNAISLLNQGVERQ